MSIIEAVLDKQAASSCAPAPKPELLLLVHRIPYPPNKGDKIRSYHLLKFLAERYRVHLGTFVDDPDDWQHVPKVEALCASSHFVRLGPLQGRLRSLGALARGASLSRGFYRDRGMRAWVENTMATHGVERIMMFSSPMAQYAEAYPQARRVIDFCDVDSDKWRQYADKKPFPMNWLYRHEAKCLLAYERAVAARFDASLFVSAPEAELFRQLAPESAERIGFFNNGVDTDYFTPDQAYSSPFAAGELPMVFTGAMDYWPNVDAVQWFADHVLPQVLAQVPQARFYIVGARPSQAVQSLANRPGIHVTGTVPDVRPYLAHARVAVAPLRIARGIQNKVLEAMAMGCPVVASPQAFEGIEAEPDKHLLVADAPPDYAAAVAGLLHAPGLAMGAAARACVQARYSWSAHLSRIEARLECT